MGDVRPPVTLDYDEPTAAAMLAALYTCPPVKRLDTLAVVIKVYVEREEGDHA